MRHYLNLAINNATDSQISTDLICESVALFFFDFIITTVTVISNRSKKIQYTIAGFGTAIFTLRFIRFFCRPEKLKYYSTIFSCCYSVFS